MLDVTDIIRPKFERHLDLEFEIIYENAWGNKHTTILVSSEFAEGYHIKKYR